ncbi:MAG: hypothetical protein WHT07_03260 [Desulfobaccales bacterium]
MAQSGESRQEHDPQVAEEALADTLIDLAAYGVLAYLEVTRDGHPKE